MFQGGYRRDIHSFIIWFAHGSGLGSATPQQQLCLAVEQRPFVWKSLCREFHPIVMHVGVEDLEGKKNKANFNEIFFICLIWTSYVDKGTCIFCINWTLLRCWFPGRHVCLKRNIRNWNQNKDLHITSSPTAPHLWVTGYEGLTEGGYALWRVPRGFLLKLVNWEQQMYRDVIVPNIRSCFSSGNKEKGRWEKKKFMWNPTEIQNYNILKHTMYTISQLLLRTQLPLKKNNYIPTSPAFNNALKFIKWYQRPWF